MSVRERLFESSPYAGFDVSEVAPDLTGWGSDHPVFAAAIRALRPRLIVEVGSWKGASAIHMARLLRAEGIAGEIVCVDTWLGAPIAWTTEPHLKPELRLRHGYPQLYWTFLRNVTDAGVEDIVTPLPASSDGGFQVLRHFGVRPELVYVDADHERNPVRRDLENALAILAPGGLIIGDDFGCWPGVTEAAKAFAEAHDLYAVKQREKIVLSRVEIARRLGIESDGYYDRRPEEAPAR